MITVSQNYCNL